MKFWETDLEFCENTETSEMQGNRGRSKNYPYKVRDLATEIGT